MNVQFKIYVKVKGILKVEDKIMNVLELAIPNELNILQPSMKVLPLTVSL